jgi:CheY-like chemotaxis protein
MSESKQDPQPFAYVMIIEPDDTVRDSILRTVEAPNCAVDVARDEDEAVMKALQHRPQLIIVKQHEPLYVDALQPPSVSIASQICRRARLSRAVRLVTHSDTAITFKLREDTQFCAASNSATFKDAVLTFKEITEHHFMKTLSVPNQCVIVRPIFKTQLWRKEWYSYCPHDIASKFLSDHLPFWLGHKQPYPLDIPYVIFPGSYKPFVRSDIITLN